MTDYSAKLEIQTVNAVLAVVVLLCSHSSGLQQLPLQWNSKVHPQLGDILHVKSFSCRYTQRHAHEVSPCHSGCYYISNSTQLDSNSLSQTVLSNTCTLRLHHHSPHPTPLSLTPAKATPHSRFLAVFAPIPHKALVAVALVAVKRVLAGGVEVTVVQA